MDEVVWIHELRRFGFLVERHATHSKIRYQENNDTWTEALVENDDYDLWEERAIEFETD